MSAWILVGIGSTGKTLCSLVSKEATCTATPRSLECGSVCLSSRWFESTKDSSPCSCLLVPGLLRKPGLRFPFRELFRAYMGGVERQEGTVTSGAKCFS